MIKKVSTQQLKTGMFICGNDRKWLDTPFFRSKFLIKSDMKVKEIQEYCHFVFIDTEKGLDVPVQADDHLPDNNDPASKIYCNGQQQLDAILQAAQLGQTIDHEKLKTITQDLLDGLNQYPDAILRLTWQENQDSSSASKTVNILIQALALAKHIKVGEELLQILGQGAILSGVGAALSLLDNAENPIENLERVDALISDRSHDSKRALEQNGLLQAILLMATLFNDLRDGRSDGVRLSWNEALQQMAVAGSDMFDADQLGYFMDALGLYPLHSMVELNSGELGSVVEVDQHTPKRPILRVVTDTQKQLLEQKFILRLAEPSAEQYKIVRVLPVDDPLLELLLIHLG